MSTELAKLDAEEGSASHALDDAHIGGVLHAENLGRCAAANKVMAGRARCRCHHRRARAGARGGGHGDGWSGALTAPSETSSSRCAAAQSMVAVGTITNKLELVWRWTWGWLVGRTAGAITDELEPVRRGGHGDGWSGALPEPSQMPPARAASRSCATSRHTRACTSAR